jgi:hypothetical protein
MLFEHKVIAVSLREHIPIVLTVDAARYQMTSRPSIRVTSLRERMTQSRNKFRREIFLFYTQRQIF